MFVTSIVGMHVTLYNVQRMFQLSINTFVCLIRGLSHEVFVLEWFSTECRK